MLAGPAINQAIRRVRESIEIWVNIPFAWYQRGLLELLRGYAYETLKMYARGIALSPSTWILQKAFDLLNRFQPVKDDIDGFEWVFRFLLLALAVRGESGAMERIKKLQKRRENYSEPVIIPAGGCDERVQARMSEYTRILRYGFESFHGTLCSGGTREGIAGIAGEIGEFFV